MKSENKELVSIINLCYNTGARILVTLESIKNQTYHHFEVIVVDDCSEDDSVLLVKEWIACNTELKITLIEHKKNKGIPAALNDAIQYCKGKYIASIGDDRWEPRFLERLLPILRESGDEVALVYSKLISFDVANNKDGDELNPFQVVADSGFAFSTKLFQPQGNNTYYLGNPWLKEMLLTSNIVVANATLIKKDILIAQGGYDEKYVIEDYPLWLKLSSSFSFIYVDEVLGSFMRYPTNYSTQFNFKMKLSVMQLFINSYDKTFSRETLFRIQNRVVTNLVALYQYSFRHRNLKLAISVSKSAIQFLRWPASSTYNYFTYKIKNKISSSRSKND